MKISEQCDSLVLIRIKELQKELEKTKNLLQKELLTAKINYLKKLVDLPLYMAISTMTLEQLKEVQIKYGCSMEETQSFLIRLFGLEPVRNMIKQPKTVTLEYLKSIMLNDLELAEELLELQRQNFEYTDKKNQLYGIGLNGTTSYLQLSHDEKNLNGYEAKLESAIEEVDSNYSLEILKELKMYQNDSNKPLTREFILRHSEKVIAKNPNMKKVIKRFTQKGILGRIFKLSPFRKKQEKAFLNTVLDCYHQNDSLALLGIQEQDVLAMNATQIRSLLKRIKKQTNQKRNKITKQKNEIRSSKKMILEKIKQYDILQNNTKEKFLSLLLSKTNFLPKMFQDQIWNEPNLKESLIRFACYEEEKELIQTLSKPAPDKTELLTQMSKQKQYIKAA